MKKHKVVARYRAAALAGRLIVRELLRHAASGPEPTSCTRRRSSSTRPRADARRHRGGRLGQIGVPARARPRPFESAVAGNGAEPVASTAGWARRRSRIVERPTRPRSKPGDPTAEPLWGQQWDMAQIDVPAAPT